MVIICEDEVKRPYIVHFIPFFDDFVQVLDLLLMIGVTTEHTDLVQKRFNSFLILSFKQSNYNMKTQLWRKVIYSSVR